MARQTAARSSPVALATAVAGALACAYLAWPHPPGQDLAAAVFRAELFEREGFTDHNPAWYGGHPVLSYSVLYPPLGALLGARLTAAISVVAAAAAFAVLARRRLGPGAALGSVWFAAATAAWLLTGRVPFLLALPFGIGAVLAADARRFGAAGVLAALCALASPVAGAFTTLAGLAAWLAGHRRAGTALALGGALPVLAFAVVSPVGGQMPLALSAVAPIPVVAAVAIWLLPPERRTLRIALALYAAAALAALVVPNPLGGNVTRLGALFAGPVLAMALWPRGRLVVAAVCLPLLYWQLIAPARDVLAAGDVGRADERAFYEPLLARLDRAGPGRVQIPPTRNRWEAAYVAPEHPLARGWLRQLESDDVELFTEERLDATSYRAWLDENEVDYVAVAQTELDQIGKDEARLISNGLAYLDPVWSGDDWKLFRVR